MIDGEAWYVSPSGYRQRVSTHSAKNTNRVFINGKYVGSSRKVGVPGGRYRSWDDAMGGLVHEPTIRSGDVYVISNPAWPDWVKVGRALEAQDRLNGYQTGSPFRDYGVEFSMPCRDRYTTEAQVHDALADRYDRRGEWFRCEPEDAIRVIQSIHGGN